MERKKQMRYVFIVLWSMLIILNIYFFINSPNYFIAGLIGFIFGMIACIADFAFGYLAQSSAIMAGSILFAVFNVRAFYKWKKLKVEINDQE